MRYFYCPYWGAGGSNLAAVSGNSAGTMPLANCTTADYKGAAADVALETGFICAFANCQGGKLRFGVTPGGKLVGQEVSDQTLEELAPTKAATRR